jgi:uncharacterized membrane protein
VTAIRLALAACLTASLIWLAAIVAAPAGLRDDATPLARASAELVYLTGHTVCHQRPERSFTRAGHPLPVCARCTGIYAAAPIVCLIALCLPAGLLAAASRRLATPRAIAIAALPTIVTVLVEWTTGWTDAGVRAAAGVALGIGGAGLVCGAIGLRADAGPPEAPPALPRASARL